MSEQRRPFGLFGGALKCGGTRRPSPDPDPSKDGMTGGRNSNIFNCLNLAPFRGQKDRQTDVWRGKRVEVEVEQGGASVISKGYILLGSSSDDSKDDERDLSGFALILMQYLSVNADTVQIQNCVIMSDLHCPCLDADRMDPRIFRRRDKQRRRKGGRCKQQLGVRNLQVTCHHFHPLLHRSSLPSLQIFAARARHS